jgi:hypothetical protein
MNWNMNDARLRRFAGVAFFVAFAFLAPSRYAGVDAGSAAEDARQIVEEVQKRATSKSQRYEGVLQTFNADGKTSEKRWIFERIGAHGRSKSIIRFTEPPEVFGVALLIVNHLDRASDQWMWTPALQRDRRIALQDRSTRFFGTDFSFEDLEERVVDHYDHTLLGEEAIDGADTWTIEAVAKGSRASQYSKQILWIRKDNYVVVRIDSYVREPVVRRLQLSRIRPVQDIWTAHEMMMSDLVRGSRTRLLLEKVQYNLPLRESDFTVQALRR